MGTTDTTTGGVLQSFATDLRRHWGWLLVLGILLLILGILAVLYSVEATVVSMLYLGWILVIAGIIEAVQAFRYRAHGHLFLHLLSAVLSLVVGVMLLRSPLAGAAVFTLLLAMYLVVAGIYRIVTGARVKAPGRGWIILDGVVTLILGILLWSQWPISGLWVIGMFIGIHFIFVGWSEVMMAMALRAIPKRS